MAKKLTYSSPRLTKWLGAIILLITITAAVVYVFSLNHTPVTLTYYKGKTWEASLAEIVLFVFFGGVVCSAFVFSILFLFQAYAFRKFRKGTSLIQTHHEAIVKARESLAAGDIQATRSILQRILKQDPQNILARIMLATTHRSAGSPKDALVMLDEARQVDKQNLELLFVAAELNEQLGNATAACDNFALALKAAPHSQSIIKNLVRLSTKLNRYDDALSYQDQLIRLSHNKEHPTLQEHRASIELSKASFEHPANSPELKSAISDILQRHKDYAPALLALARIEASKNDKELATKHLTAAYKRLMDPAILHSIARLWIDENNPDRAIASVKNAIFTRTKIGAVSHKGQIALIGLFLSLGKIDEAGNELHKLKNTELSTDANNNLLLPIALLESYIANRNNNVDMAYELLASAVENTLSDDMAEAFPIDLLNANILRQPKVANLYKHG